MRGGLSAQRASRGSAIPQSRRRAADSRGACPASRSSVTSFGTSRSAWCVVASRTRSGGPSWVLSAAISMPTHRHPVSCRNSSVCPGTSRPAARSAGLETGAVTSARYSPSIARSTARWMARDETLPALSSLPSKVPTDSKSQPAGSWGRRVSLPKKVISTPGGTFWATAWKATSGPTPRGSPSVTAMRVRIRLAPTLGYGCTSWRVSLRGSSRPASVVAADPRAGP